MAIHFEILKETENGLIWLPDSSEYVTEWENIRIGILNKMWLFVEFWYNVLTDNPYYYPFGLRISLNYPSDIKRFISLSTNDNNISFDTTEYNPQNLINQKLEDQILKESIEYCFNKFLLFLKDKI